MQTQCNAEQYEFSCIERRRVVASFDGGRITSDAGALLLKRTDDAIGLIDRLAHCFIDGRRPDLIEHSVRTLLGQRLFALALGYEPPRLFRRLVGLSHAAMACSGICEL